MLFNIIKIPIGMIKLHWKNLGLKLAFSATTKIFRKETKLFNFTLFFPLACISNILGVYFVWLVVLSFCFGGYFSILLKQWERFNHEAPTTFQAMCFSPFIMDYHCCHLVVTYTRVLKSSVEKSKDYCGMF